MTIEKILFDFLRGDKSLPLCFFEFQPNKPKQLVIDRVGGSIDFINRTVFAVQVYDESQVKILQDCDKVIARLKKMSELGVITSVEIGTIQDFPDLTRKLRRYQILVEFYHY